MADIKSLFVQGGQHSGVVPPLDPDAGDLLSLGVAGRSALIPVGKSCHVRRYVSQTYYNFSKRTMISTNTP
ncbi:MAG: hypothetical protein CSA52_03120 [Gammaproteobacteria bacterium]|nr:MAG: hypothetical protein CSA52_03120 [Gammaproteobacteria bacterium]